MMLRIKKVGQQELKNGRSCVGGDGCLFSYGLARIRIYSIFVLIKRGLLVYLVNNINQRQRVSFHPHPITPCPMNRIESVVFTSGIRRIYIQSVCV